MAPLEKAMITPIGSPLRDFAERIVRNDEYEELIQAIAEQHGDLAKLATLLKQHR